MARDEGVGGRPTARVVAPDQVGVGAADRDRADAREDLVGSGHGDRDFLDLEHAGLEDDEGLHRRYLATIPVIALDSRELEMATTTAKIERFLADAV